LMAASKLSWLVALISVTRATLMGPPSLPLRMLPFHLERIPGGADK
jgi:hypothetical protein